MRSATAFLCLALLVAVAPESQAKERPDEKAARARGEALRASIVERHALEPGTWWYAVCPAPALNVGTARLTLEAAPPDSEAAWHVIFELKIGLGEGLRISRMENSLLAPDLTLLSFKSSYHQDVPDEDAWWEVEGKREKGRWILQASQRRGEKERQGTVEAAATPHSISHATVLLLARHLDRKTPQTWRFTLVAMEKIPHALAGPPELEMEKASFERSLDVSLGEAREVLHRGKPAHAHEVKVSLGMQYMDLLDVATDGRLLSMRPSDGPVRMVLAAGEVEARRPLVEPTPVDPEGPIAKVLVLLACQAKAVDAKALDDVIDWKALRAAPPFDLDEAEGGLLDEDAFRAKFVEFLQSERNAIPKAVADAMASVLEARIAGDAAEVFEPESIRKYRLRETEKGWLIVHMPRLW